jgi:hypothetical protein
MTLPNLVILELLTMTMLFGTIININENLNIKFINSILVTPKFQRIISSLLFSNFDVMWNMLKNNTNGSNLLNILGKLSNE